MILLVLKIMWLCYYKERQNIEFKTENFQERMETRKANIRLLYFKSCDSCGAQSSLEHALV